MSSEPRVEVRLEVDMGSEAAASAALEGLSPDNVDLPPGMELEMRAEGPRLIVVVRHNLRSADTLASTVDEILEHASLVYRVLFGEAG